MIEKILTINQIGGIIQSFRWKDRIIWAEVAENTDRAEARTSTLLCRILHCATHRIGYGRPQRCRDLLVYQTRHRNARTYSKGCSMWSTFLSATSGQMILSQSHDLINLIY
jgi:hypothetical protein